MKHILVSLTLATMIAAAPTVLRAEDPTPTPKPTVSPSPAKVQYTCTMHPEVVTDKPGDCPKCGMKLVPKKDSEKKDGDKPMK